MALGLVVAIMPGRTSQPELSASGSGYGGVGVLCQGTGSLVWFLPVMLNQLLAEAQVSTLSTEELAQFVKQKGLGDLASGLPTAWKPEAIKAVAKRMGNEKGYVLVASFHSDVPEAKRDENTLFWLEARLTKGEEVVFDTTRFPREQGQSYRLGDYDKAVKELAEIVIQDVSPEKLADVKRCDLWNRRVTFRQIQWMVEAEQDVAADRLEEAAELFRKAAALVDGEAGAAMARDGLLDVDEALRKRNPEAGRRAAHQTALDADGYMAKAEDTLAGGYLAKAEDCRFQDDWKGAAQKYALLVKFLRKRGFLQLADIEPEALRDTLALDDPPVWDKLASAGPEAEWWATVALALYRDGHSDLAAPVAARAEECATEEKDERARADALLVLATDARLLGSASRERSLCLAAVGILEKAAPDSLSCARAYCGLLLTYVDGQAPPSGQNWGPKAAAIYDAHSPGSVEAARCYLLVCWACAVAKDRSGMEKWLDKSLSVYRAQPGDSLEMAEGYGVSAHLLDGVGQQEEAMEYANLALGIRRRLSPDSLECAVSYRDIGALCLELGRSDEALDAARSAAEIDSRLAPGLPVCAADYSAMGQSYFQQRSPDLALHWFTKALPIQESLLPGSQQCSDTYLWIGSCHRIRGDSDGLDWYLKGLAIRERLVPGSPECADAYDCVGDAYIERHESEQALASHEKALEIRHRIWPDSHVCAESLTKVARLVEAKGDTARALRLYEQAATIYDASGPAYLELADLSGKISLMYATRKDEAAALRWARKHLGSVQAAVAANPGVSPADPGIVGALVYVSLGQFEHAHGALEGVCAQDPGRLATLLGGNGPVMITLMAEALLVEGKPGGYYVLGRVWETLGKTADAAAAYEVFLKNAKGGYPWRDDATARLQKLRGK